MNRYFYLMIFVVVAGFIALDAQRLESDNPICRLPFESGLCYAAFQRWYYNSQANQCQTFTYGGCGGNKNNFETRLDCQRTCRGFRG